MVTFGPLGTRTCFNVPEAFRIVKLCKCHTKVWAYITPASIYGQLGREKEAHAAAKELLRIDPKFSVKNWEKWPCKNRDKWNQWLSGIRKAGLK